MATESFYGGAGSSLDPGDGNPFVGYRFEKPLGSRTAAQPEFGDPFVGYQLEAKDIGFSSNPMTANQLQETMRGIRSGAKVIEVNLLNVRGDTDQQIPLQHFKEIRALTKLAGVSPSIHGPLLEATGFQSGGGRAVFSEEERQRNEERMFGALEKAKLADPDKNIPVVFHTTNMLGGMMEHVPGNTQKGEERFKEEVVAVYNKQTKELTPITESTMYRLGGEKENEKNPFKYTQTIDGSIRAQNETLWDNELKNLTLEKKYADEALQQALLAQERLQGAGETAQKLSTIKGNEQVQEQVEKEFEQAQVGYGTEITKAQTLLHNNHLSFNTIFSQAYKSGTKEHKKELEKLSEEWRKEEETWKEKQKERNKKGSQNPVTPYEELARASQMQDIYFTKLRDITEKKAYKDEKTGNIVEVGLGAPQTIVRGEEFAMEQAAKTFGNMGAKSYNELGGINAPMLAIENVWNGAFFARGKKMAELIEKSREHMTKKLMKEQNMKEKEATKAAEKIIGMNFDVGHMNMYKKRGFTDKDMAGEIKHFAKYINHMHITDNFGFSDEHLAPGQGNVPFKEFFKEIAKHRPEGMEGFKKISETGGVENRTLGDRSAHALTLAAFGVPISGPTTNAYGGNFDATLDTFGSYSAGLGMINPEVHHSVYGGGFSGMPPELGGQIPGMGGNTARSRFGGAPLA